MNFLRDPLNIYLIYGKLDITDIDGPEILLDTVRPNCTSCANLDEITLSIAGYEDTAFVFKNNEERNQWMLWISTEQFFYEQAVESCEICFK